MRPWLWFVLSSAFLLVPACGGGGGVGGGLPCGPGVACPTGHECVNNVCKAPGGGADDDGSGGDAAAADGCSPSCGERRCGPDECGGSCGSCGADSSCNASGLCVPDGCVADCAGRQCGSDGCAGDCGTCPGGSSCNQAGRCVSGPCTADCAGRECGGDGCDGSCGDCAAGESCSDGGRCVAGPCEPRCAGRECGPDGCGHLCGTCTAGETCSGTTCVPGACGEGAPSIEGALLTDVTDVGFGAVSIRMSHKQDIDPVEDGCITEIELEFTNGVGCRLFLAASGAWDVDGGLRIARLEFGADSQCREFYDDREGDFAAAPGEVIGSIVPASQAVPDANATESCFATTLRVRLEPRTLDGQSFDGEPRVLEIAGSTLRVTGEVVSLGDTRARCPCQPACSGRECGDDDCGGSCGACAANGRCEAGLCVCVPSCSGKQCGDDGCGGSCGGCSDGLSCVEGRCVCVPECAGRDCGSDGCGATCGACDAGEVCSAGGRCECQRHCTGRECGPDGCGGTCGSCAAGEPCSANGRCGCDPQCAGRTCGDDGCGGSCGACGWGWTCEADGKCGCGAIDHLGCCEGAVALWCESDPFGGGDTIRTHDCGTQVCAWVNAQTGYYCGGSGSDPGGRPRDCGLATCEPRCAGRECGDDGCGDSCGSCPTGEGCDGGQCVPCQRQCSGRECGDDGCGGSCGTCPTDESCTTAGRCAAEPPLEEFGKSCTTTADCFEGLTCVDFFGIKSCSLECTPFVDQCPHGLVCFPDLSGSGTGYCISNPSG